MDRVITTPEELVGLLKRAARRGIGRVTLDLGLRDDDAQRLEDSLNRGLRSCGCEVGAMFVAIGLTVQLGVALLAPGEIRWPTFQEIGRFGLVLLALALAGKIVGLIAAEWRFRRAIGDAIRRLGRGVPLERGEVVSGLPQGRHAEPVERRCSPLEAHACPGRTRGAPNEKENVRNERIPPPTTPANDPLKRQGSDGYFQETARRLLEESSFVTPPKKEDATKAASNSV